MQSDYRRSAHSSQAEIPNRSDKQERHKPTANGFGVFGRSKVAQPIKLFGLPQPIVDADDPHRIAEAFVDDYCTTADGVSLRYWRGDFWRFDGSIFRKVAEDDLKAHLCAAAKQEIDRVAQQEALEAEKPPKVKKVTARLTNDVRHALASLLLVPSEVEQPCWLDGRGSAQDLVACRNGLLHLPSYLAGGNCFTRSTPQFFSSNCFALDFDQQAPQPVEWLRFLDSVFPNEAQSVALLQEHFGYLLVPDLSHHKILLMIGPRRAGKGVIMRVQQALLGAANFAPLSTTSLSGRFGLNSCVGKLAGYIPDARFGSHTDLELLVERLLSVSGQDNVCVERKNRDDLQVTLSTRFIIACNPIPDFRDSSGALAGRLLLLRFTESFFGREDKSLDSKLRQELPGIFLWAIKGWDRLRQNGAFTEPKSSVDLHAELEAQLSPISEFVEECCLLGAGLLTTKQDLFDAWQKWCDPQRITPGDLPTFARELYAAFQTRLLPGRLNVGGRRVSVFRGIAIS